VLPDAETTQLPSDRADPPPEEAPVGAAAGATARRPSRKPRRASVPSWDDIVFGQRRD
jgi:hypothetical protein